MKKKIAILNGDGIGPEVTNQSVRVLNAVAERFGHTFEYHEALIGADAIDKTGTALPSETIDICLDCDAVLFGAVGHPKYDNDPNAKVRPEQGILGIRKALQLFANIRPVTTYPTLQHLCPIKPKNMEGVDFIIFRELTGGIYFGEKTLSEDGSIASDPLSSRCADSLPSRTARDSVPFEMLRWRAAAPSVNMGCDPRAACAAQRLRPIR